MDLLPTPVTECNKQRTGALFTVRSANSPSYSLTRRPGVRGAKGFSVEQREDTEEVGKRERYGTNTNVSNEEDDRVVGHQARTGWRSSVTDQCEEKVTPGHDNSPKLNQNGIGDKLTTGTGSEVPVKSENPAFESRDSAESRRSNWQSRSKSLDWRTGRTNADKGGEDLKKQIGGLDGRQSAAEGVSGRVMFSRQTYNSVGTRDVTRERSPVRHMSQTLDRTSRGHSLPSRFRPQSSSGSTTSEPTGGQSIMERIEKLYVSAGFGKDESCSKVKDPITTTDTPRSYERAAGATLPRERSKKSITWASQTVSETFSPERSRRLSGDECQGKIQGSHPEDSGVNWRKGFTEVGTKSLDRARTRNTKAANIRETRAQDETNGINWAKETDEMKGGSTDDVFESNPKNDTLKTTDRKKFSEMPSAASVRNKISQFEALTQRAQGLATGQALMHRRAMSVPTHLNKGHDGVKKSGSAKAIDGLKDKWAGMKEGGEMDEEKVTAAGKKAVSERSLSLDEVGLKSRRKEEPGEDLVDTERKSNDSTEDFGKHSRLKGTLEIPLNGGAQRRRNFYIDETDFSKLSSPEESSEKNNSVPSSPPSNPNHTSTSVQKISPTVITSPVRDDDKTPTNFPDHSPFHSPSTQLENTSPATQGHDRASVIIQEAKTHDPDSSPVPRPLATSSHSNLPDLISPDVKTVNHKGKKQPLDLDAWVASLKSDMKVWNDNEDDEDDEDDDDDSTQKDEDSNYDSDSGESSVTITSNMSQSDRRSFSVSLSDLCNFAGVDYESENDSDEWQLVTGRTASLSSDVSALSYVSVMPTEELDRLLEDVRSLGDNTLQDYDDVHVVVLHKEVGVGLGFSVAGGVDQNKPVTVHKIFHSGVAAQEGSMREGDQVLSINGTAFQNYAHWEVLRVLRRSKSREMAVVVLRRGGLDDASKTGVPTSNQAPTQTELTETGQQMCVRLEKNNRDLGFSLEGGVGSSLGNRPLTVQKIFQGGPVDKVCPGDEVMEIEGVSVVGMRRLEAWTLIRKLPSGPVDVVLRRPLKHLET